jgi:hypothetical protein
MVLEASLGYPPKFLKSNGDVLHRHFYGVHIGVHDSAKMGKIGQDWCKLQRG